MELLQLYYFKKVAELQHMSHAASQLHLTQPTLSKTISNLEEDLHVKLFDRIGKNIILNQNGKILLKYTDRILAAVSDAKAEIADYNENYSTAVTLLSMHAVTKILPNMLVKFHQLHPEIKFEIDQYNNRGNNEEDYDIMLDSSLVKNDGPYTKTLLREKILLVIPKGHPLLEKSHIYLKDIAEESFIMLPKKSTLHKIIVSSFHDIGFYPNIIFETNNPSTISALIQSGMGISLLPAITWEDIGENAIEFRPIEDFPLYRYITLSWRRNGYLSKAADLFKNFIIEYFENLEHDK